MTHHVAGKSSDVVGVAAIAAVVGVAAALLLAPRSGKDTRSALKRKIHDAQARAKQKAADMKTKTVDTVDEARTKAEEAAVDAKDAVTEARSQVEDIAIETQPRPRARRSTTL